jgi:hypothetical protein
MLTKEQILDIQKRIENGGVLISEFDALFDTVLELYAENELLKKLLTPGMCQPNDSSNGADIQTIGQEPI